MQNLLGTHFVLDKNSYAIVDVRDVAGETMVYAEPQTPCGNDGPKRAAFRYIDIISLLSEQRIH